MPRGYPMVRWLVCLAAAVSLAGCAARVQVGTGSGYRPATEREAWGRASALLGVDDEDWPIGTATVKGQPVEMLVPGAAPWQGPAVYSEAEREARASFDPLPVPATLDARVGEIHRSMAQALAEMKRAGEEVGLEAARIRAEAPRVNRLHANGGSVRGTVLSRVVYNGIRSVTLNVGHNDGVRDGMHFITYSGTDVTGVVRVMSTSQQSSVAKVRFERPAIGLGDLVARVDDARVRSLPLRVMGRSVINGVPHVTLDGGAREGIEEGTDLSVERGYTTVALLRVTSVSQETCYAKIVQSAMRPEAGDLVRVVRDGK